MSHHTRLFAAVTALAVAAGLSACASEQPDRTPAPSATPTQTQTPTPSQTPTPTPSATEGSDDDIALPGSCEQIYSDAMFAQLNTQAPPLNHPDVTMFSTQNAALLEIQTSGIPTLRCTWGAPSEFGLATNVSIVDAQQSAAVDAALRADGFECGVAVGGTICRIEREILTLDDDIVKLGETHFLRGNGWVSTAWVIYGPEGYTEDIAATLWG